MAKTKGMFQDPDRFTQRHNEIVNLLRKHEYLYEFTSEYGDSITPGYKIEIEKPVYAKNGFLYGFADAVVKGTNLFPDGDWEQCLIIDGRKDFNPQQEKWLIEVKSSFKDVNEVLRQIKIYRDSIEGIDKTFLLYYNYSGDNEEMSTIFLDEGITALEVWPETAEISDNFKNDITDFFLRWKGPVEKPIPNLLKKLYNKRG